MLTNDLRAFIELLNSHGIEYLVVGAHALAHHGYPRYTGDLGIFVRRSKPNAEGLVKIVGDFGFGSKELAEVDLEYLEGE